MEIPTLFILKTKDDKVIRTILILNLNKISRTIPGNTYYNKTIKGEATTIKSYKKVKMSYKKVKPLYQTEERAKKYNNHETKEKQRNREIKMRNEFQRRQIQQ